MENNKLGMEKDIERIFGLCMRIRENAPLIPTVLYLDNLNQPC